MTIFLVTLAALYAVLTVALQWGWQRVVPVTNQHGRQAKNLPKTWPLRVPAGQCRTDELPARQPRISVIIPVRNEAENLPRLLGDLARQRYTQFEVIVADDSSTDETVAVVRGLMNELPYTLHLLPLSDERTGAPKKRAIAQSIRVATGELILTTDGDCRVGPDWVRSFARFYAEHHPKMITGPVTFTNTPGLFAHLQTVEFASLIGSGAATLALGVPTMCNGANLCYEKRVFEEVGGFAGIDHVASGDDELLMHKIARRYPGGVRFLKDPAAIVETAPHGSWRAFYNQRKRWASKWRAYDSWQPSALAVFVFLSNMAPVLAVWGGILGWIGWPWVLMIIALKTGPEFLFLRTVLCFSQKEWAIRWIPLTQLVYPFYVLFFGLAAQKKGFTWKGRTLE